MFAARKTKLGNIDPNAILQKHYDKNKTPA